MEQSKIDRINELARKKKAIGLTQEEIREQKELREEYLLAIRANIKNTLDSTYIEHPDGSRTKLQKKNK